MSNIVWSRQLFTLTNSRPMLSPIVSNNLHIRVKAYTSEEQKGGLVSVSFSGGVDKEDNMVSVL